MRILILHAGALGDCVLTIHVAAALRRAGHCVTMASRSSIPACAARRELIDHYIPLDHVGAHLWRNSSDEAVGDAGAILRKSYDCFVSFLGGREEYVSERLWEQLGPDNVIFIDPKPDQMTAQGNRHIVQQWIAELCWAEFNLELDPGLLSASQAVGSSCVDPSAPSSSRSTNPMIFVHPGSGGRHKCCPLGSLESLMQQLRQSGANARWMIGPDEMERDGPALFARIERLAPVVFEESLDRATDLVAAADAYIGNDAGMTHVAALMGIRTVALFGPTDPRIWRPLGMRCTAHMFPDDKSDTTWVDSVSGLLLNCLN